MPPRVGAVRVMASLGPGLSLTTPGFGQPTSTRNEKGQRILVVNHALQPTDDQIEKVSFTIDGLPSKAFSRWLALGLTMLLMAGGMAASFFMRRNPAASRSIETLRQQRESLLQSLSRVEDEYQQRNISEDNYKFERASLLSQLAAVLARLNSR
jgi:hypothetical protein